MGTPARIVLQLDKSMSQKRQQGTISTQEEKRSSLPDLNPLDPMREVRVQERDASVEDGLPEEEEADGGSNDPRAEVLGEDAAGGDYERRARSAKMTTTSRT